MKKLSGKIALVTGAGQGVGQGIALSLAKEGALVAVAGRTLAKCVATCEQIQEVGGKAVAIAMDVKDPESLSCGVDRIVSELGGLNILVNNAQEIALGTLNKITDEAFEAGWQSGPLATLRLMRLCYPHLKGDGVIINLASTAAKRWDMSGYGPYAAVKEAIRSLSRAAACEWGPDNIRCNVVLPHAKSPSLEWWMNNNPDEAEAFVKAIPMRRVGECESDIGRVVASLCSDDMRYINGQSIAVDGGQAFMG
ncbi:SDR family NAD(P)-dependent oxidoreductase [Endozoicomonas atrinae]|uniref:SDR family NAD(P)-dependent oxidoreductase n=1 Tax=Endozoicomonas atrinae TaxID=1333660 RepID=UPI000826AD52|nr:SDR family oxidoreductase [Endozoicomonas atrinae]